MIADLESSGFQQVTQILSAIAFQTRRVDGIKREQFPGQRDGIQAGFHTLSLLIGHIDN
jgi:hypothetical protein